MNLSNPNKDLVVNIVSRYRDFLYSRDYSTPTVKNYTSDLRYFASWTERKFQAFSFDKITYRNISEYRSDIKEIFKGKPAIAARRLSSLKIFVGWAVSQNLLPEELLKTLESGKRDKDDLAVVGRFRTYLLSAGYSKPTIKNYLSDLRHLIDWIAKNYEQFKFAALTEESVRNYRSHLKDKFRTKPSISARRLSSLRKFLSWAGKNGLVTEDLLRSLQKALALPAEKPTPTVVVPPTPIQIVPPTPLPTPSIPVDTSKYKPHQKVIHHIRHTRPGWYHAYHQRDWASTLHTVITILFAVLVGSLFLYTEVIRPMLDQTREQFAQELGDVLAAATPPRMLSFQGRLTDDSDVPVTSSTNIVFKIYTVRTGGTPIWTSKTWPVTPDQNGIFSVCLGGQDTGDDCLINGVADTVIPSTLFAENDALYLGVTAGADSEMTPRQRIASVSYALNSDALEGFHGSQSPGANEVPILDGSGNLMFAGAATIDTGSGALTLGSAGSATIQLPASGDDVSLTGDLDVSGHIAAGAAATSVDTNKIVYLNETAGSSGDFVGLDVEVDLPVADTSNDYWAINARLDQHLISYRDFTGTVGAVRGEWVTGTEGNTNTWVKVFEAATSAPDFTMVLDTTNYAAYYANPIESANNVIESWSAHVDNQYGVYIDGMPSYSAYMDIDNNYGLYIEELLQTSVTAMGITDVYPIYQAGTSGTNVFNAATNFTLPAAGNISIDAATTDNTTTGGVIDLEIDTVTDENIGIYIDYELVDDADATDDVYAMKIDLLNSSGDATDDLYGILMQAFEGTGEVRAFIDLDYQKAGVTAMMDDAILIRTSTATTYILDAIDVSDAEIVNAINVGSNAIAVADGFAMDLSTVNMSNSTEGIHLGQSTSCSSATAEGQTCWDTDGDSLYIGTGATAKEIGAGGGPTIVRKTADESVTSSTTLQDDDHLTWSVGANETWAFTFNIEAYINSTPDYKFAITAPSGSTCNYSGGIFTYYTTTGPVGASDTCGGSVTLLTYSGGSDQPVIVQGVISTSSTSGNITFQFAQNTSSATSIYHRAGSFVTAYNITGSDLAEVYRTNDLSITPGTLVSIDPELRSGVKKTQGAYDSKVLGVVSTQPGQILGSGSGPGHPVFLGLVGQVPTRVSTENGSIHPGDLLTTSSIPGVAMKATRAGYVVGRALTSFDGDPSASSGQDSVGTILVFINTHYANPVKIDGYGNLQDLESSQSATSSAFLSFDTENNLVAIISAGTKFVWTNSIGEAVAWVSDTGEAFFKSIKVLAADIKKLIIRDEVVIAKEADISGTAKFDKDEQEVEIKSDKVTKDSLIYLTPTTKTDGMILFVVEKIEGKGFTVGLDTSDEFKELLGTPKEATPSASRPIEFNWLIINQE